MLRIRLKLSCIILFLLSFSANAMDDTNKASLQRGAKLFMNYCSGCHSLTYLRYSQMAKGLGLIGFDGRVDEDLLKNNLIFTKAAVNEPIRIALPAVDAKQWFGIVPPDLSLIVKVKGRAWLSRYLQGFYHDNSRPFGTNNSVVPNVLMPDILEPLKNKAHFDVTVEDLVTFLSYVAEPGQKAQYHLGYWVITFLFLLLLPLFGLKKLYWRKITKI